MTPTILGPDGKPVSSQDSARKAMESAVVERLVVKAKAKGRPIFGVRLTANQLRGAKRRGSRAAGRERAKAAGVSLVSLAAEDAQRSRDQAKRLTADKRAAQRVRWEEHLREREPDASTSRES